MRHFILLFFTILITIPAACTKGLELESRSKQVIKTSQIQQSASPSNSISKQQVKLQLDLFQTSNQVLNNEQTFKLKMVALPNKASDHLSLKKTDLKNIPLRKSLNSNSETKAQLVQSSNEEILITKSDINNGELKLYLDVKPNESQPIVAVWIYEGESHSASPLLSSVGDLTKSNASIPVNASSTIAYELISQGGVPKVTSQGISNFHNIVEEIQDVESEISGSLKEDVFSENKVAEVVQTVQSLIKNKIASDKTVQSKVFNLVATAEKDLKEEAIKESNSAEVTSELVEKINQELSLNVAKQAAVLVEEAAKASEQLKEVISKVVTPESQEELRQALDLTKEVATYIDRLSASLEKLVTVETVTRSAVTCEAPRILVAGICEKIKECQSPTVLDPFTNRCISFTETENTVDPEPIVEEVIDQAPIIQEIAHQTVDENSSISQINASDVNGGDVDADGDTITWSCFYDISLDQNVTNENSCDSLTGLTFTSDTGVINWTPSYAQSGSYEFKIVGSEGDLRHEELFNIVVNNVDLPPDLNTINDQIVAENSPIQPIDAGDANGGDVDADGDTISYSCFYDSSIDNTVSSTNACSALAGTNFNESSGIMQWTPSYNQSGTYEFKIVGSAGSLQDSQVFSITVTNVDRAPILATIANQSVNDNSAITEIDAVDATGSDEDVDGDSITYSCFYDGTVDSTVNLDNSCDSLSGATFVSSTGVFNWTTPSSLNTVYEFRIIASEGDLEDDEIFTITITDTSSAIINSGKIKSSTNDFVDINFTEGVYSTSGGSGALQASDFNLTFSQNGGTATNATISSLSKTDGASLSGGETDIRVYLNITGQPDSQETISIKPALYSIYDLNGNVSQNSTTTGDLYLKRRGGDGTFATKVDYALDDGPEAIINADFNADGIQDLAIASSTNGNVSILLGNGSNGKGTGTFGTRTDYAVGTSPQDLTYGDFNADGILDIACLNSSSVSILLGNGSNGKGDGTFADKIDYSVDANARYLTKGDFNSDGILDLVTTAWADDRVNVLLGNGSGGKGDGTFATKVIYFCGDGPYGVKTGDFNEDGITDLITTNKNGDSFSILLGNGSAGKGNGTFAAKVDYATGDFPNGIVIGDFNADNIMDIAVSSWGTAKVNVFIGNGSNGKGNGTFAAKVEYSTGSAPFTISSGDFNGDGILDLVTADMGTDTASILLGNGSGGQGDGTFASKVSYSVGNDPEHITVGDFNGDNISDIILVNNDDNDISVLLGQGTSWQASATFHPKVEYSAGNSDIALGDFNADGIMDMVNVRNSTDLAYVLLGNGSDGKGDGTFASSVTYATAAGPQGVSVGDLNEDGILDLVAVNNTADSISIFIGNGSGGKGDGTFADKVDYASGDGGKRAEIGDFNSDGINDIAIANWSGSSVTVHLGNGSGGQGNGTFAAAVEYSTASVACCSNALVLGDYNHDNILDIAVANQGDKLSVHLGNGSGGQGDGTFPAIVGYTMGSDPNDIATADFNRDRIQDLVIANNGDNTVSVSIGNGSGGQGDGTFAGKVDYAVGAGPKGVTTADINGDGIIDIISTNYDDDTVSLLLGNGSGGKGDGTFATKVDFGVGNGPRDLIIYDFNADGILDIAVSHWFDSKIVILLGMGD